jgi:hypothetical protein
MLFKANEILKPLSTIKSTSNRTKEKICQRETSTLQATSKATSGKAAASSAVWLLVL